MKNDIILYKSYAARVHFSADDEEFYGEVLDFGKHKISFGGRSVAELKKHFKEAVDGYLAACKAHGIEATPPYSGRITYRTTPKKHAELSRLASISGEGSINALIDHAVNYYTSHILERNT